MNSTVTVETGSGLPFDLSSFRSLIRKNTYATNSGLLSFIECFNRLLFRNRNCTELLFVIVARLKYVVPSFRYPHRIRTAPERLLPLPIFTGVVKLRSTAMFSYAEIENPEPKLTESALPICEGINSFRCANSPLNEFCTPASTFEIFTDGETLSLIFNDGLICAWLSPGSPAVNTIRAAASPAVHHSNLIRRHFIIVH